MRKFVVLLALLACSMPLVYGQKTRRVGQGPALAKPGVDFPLKAHITAIHIRPGDCGGVGRFGENAACNDVIYAEINLDGKKIRCLGGPIYSAHWYEYRILPGDYRAPACEIRSLKGTICRCILGYELLARKRAWGCSVSGLLNEASPPFCEKLIR